MSEAVEAVTRMLVVYPNAKNMISDGYIGAIAAILCKYPSLVALSCVEPTGVASTTAFIPTAADVIKWLEREVQMIRSAHAWEKQSAAQFAQRARDQLDDEREPLEQRRKVADRITRELRQAFERGDGMIPNVFVPIFAPQYRAMCERAQTEPPDRAQYGHSVEDKTRMGIWVPLEWLKPTRAKRPETPEQAKARIMERYNVSTQAWDSIPDQPQTSDYWQGVRWPNAT